jgi:hypothetical protein
MTNRTWRGGATAIPQVDHVYIYDVSGRKRYGVEINEKEIYVTANDDDEVSDVCSALATAIGAYTNSVPEWSEVSATEGINDSGIVDHVVVTGPTDGRPFTLSVPSSAKASMAITEVRKGSPGNNQIQKVNVSGTTGGTFTLSFDGQTTGNINYNASAATVETALEGLSNIASGDVDVSGSTPTWSVEFEGAYANRDVELMTGDGGSLTKSGGYSVVVDTVQQGTPGQNEIQHIWTNTDVTAGTWTITYGANTTSNIQWDATADDVQSALEGIADFSSGDISVTKLGTLNYLVEFVGDWSGADASLFDIDESSLTMGDPYGVTRLQAAKPAQLEVVDVTVSGPWTIEITNAVDTEISQVFDQGATTEEVQQGLAAMDVVNAALVTKDGATYRIEFLSGPVPPVSLAAAGDNCSVTEVTGSPAVAEIQRIYARGSTIDNDPEYSDPTDIIMEADVSLGTGTATDVDFRQDNTGIDAMKTSLSSSLNPDVESITHGYRAEGTSSSGRSTYGTHYWDVQFYGPGGTEEGSFQDVPLMSLSNVTRDGGSTAGGYTSARAYSTVVQRVTDATPEIQRIQLAGGPGGGTFTLTHSGNTTGNIAWDAEADEVEESLESLASISDVEVSGPAGGPWHVKWTDGDNEPELTGSAGSLSGGRVIIEVSQTATDPVNETQRVTIDDIVTSGTFTLTFDGDTTNTLNYNASPGIMQAELEQTSGIGVGNVRVTGEPGSWDVEFVGTLGGADQNMITASTNLDRPTSHMSVQTITSPTGPYHWDEAANWSGGAVPVASDDVYFKDSSIDCRYGLDQSSITLSSLHVDSSYTGHIGLPRYTGDYYEYRDTMLQVSATNVYIGEGDGTGSAMIKLDTGTNQTDVLVQRTATGEEAEGAFIFAGTHASNVLSVQRGRVGVATEEPGQDTTLATLRIGYVDSQDTDSAVVCGDGVSQLTTINQTGGSLDVGSNLGTLTQRGGESTIRGSATVTTLDAKGTVYYTSSGTMTTAKIRAGGVLSFDRDARDRTVTSCTLYSGAELSDKFRTVTWTNPIALDGCGIEDCDLSLGTHVTIDVDTGS